MRHKISILFIIPAMLSMSKAETNVVADIDIDSLACEESDSWINIEERLNPPELNPKEDITPFLTSAGNVPSFIKQKSNIIHLNGDDWSILAEQLTKSSHFGSPFTILHIGDSHIQADAATGTTREILQDIYGNAGRGLTTPLKMAGTNEPRDYRITSTSKWKTSKLMKTPWESEMQFTGISITPLSNNFNLTVETLSSEKVKENPFNTLKIIYSGTPIIVDDCETSGKKIFYTCEYSKESAVLHFHNLIDSVTISMHADGNPCDLHIAGIELLNSGHGLIYSTIGNNGAMYMSYNALSDFNRISELSPQLVIISLGANEAFGVISDTAFRATVDSMVRRVHEAAPDAKIMLVTPIECQRRTKKSRRRAASYTINTNILRLRNIINSYGADNHIPVYDLYEIAGGEGSSAKWLSDGLLNPRDRIHLTWPGYELQGRLTAEALIKAFSSNKSSE